MRAIMLNKKVLMILLFVSTTILSFLVVYASDRYDNKVLIKATGTLVTRNSSVPTKVVANPLPNIVKVLTAISLAVGILIGILKISGKSFYIGSRKKRPYVVILKKLRETIQQYFRC